MREIENEADVNELVNNFYKGVQEDEVLAPFFAKTNWQAHLPKMIDFWCFILLDKPGFTGNVFDVHVNRGIAELHFVRWIELFKQAVDELFVGEKAKLAKEKAHELGLIFSWKLQQLEGN